MSTYKAIISYLGTNYKGFQKQNSGVATIQNTLEDILRRITSDKEIKTIGSGRTDSGVHANRQVIKISTNSSIPSYGLMKAINDLLPADIKVINLVNCEQSFHPIRDAIKKEYRYRFSFNKNLDPGLNQMVTNFYGELNIDFMKLCCETFKGKHDFRNYQTVGTDVETTVREILSAEIIATTKFSLLSDQPVTIYEFRIVGTGFLKQMVRLLMGALVEAGKGKVDQNQIKNSLTGNTIQNRLGAVAPPQGLALYEVTYPE